MRTRNSSERKNTESTVLRVSHEKKKCVVELNRLINQHKEWDVNCRCARSGKGADLQCVETMQNENKVPSLINTSISSNKCNTLKPFNAVFSLGDITFTSNDRCLKLSESKQEIENISERIPKIRKSCRRRDPKDIFEFTAEIEEDWDPTKEVVQKIVKEGRAKLVKRHRGLADKRRARFKTIPQLLQSLQRYQLRNYSKVLKERKSNCQGAWNPKIWDVSSFSKENVPSSEHSKYEQDLELKVQDIMCPNAEAGCSYYDPDYSEEVASPNDKKTQVPLGNPLKNVEIMDVVVLPNRATIIPAVTTLEEEISEDAMDTDPPMEQPDEAFEMVDLPRGSSATFDDPAYNYSNQEEYFTNEADKFNMSNFKVPSFTQTDSSTIEETSVETHKPKPIRKAFWEEENFEKENLNKSIIKKTYSRPKKEGCQSNFFIYFSDKDTGKLDESKKEKLSAYYTRSTIKDWINDTKSATGKGTKLGGKRFIEVPAKKPILKTRNKICATKANVKVKQKENKVKCKVTSKVKPKMNISDSIRVNDRKTHKLLPLRL